METSPSNYQDYAAWADWKTKELDDAEVARMFASLRDDVEQNQNLKSQLSQIKKELAQINGKEHEEEKIQNQLDLQEENALLQKQMLVQEKELRMLFEELNQQTQEKVNLQKEIFEVKKQKGLDVMSTKLRQDNIQLRKELMTLRETQLPCCGLPLPLTQVEGSSFEAMGERVQELEKENAAQRLEMEGLRKQLASREATEALEIEHVSSSVAFVNQHSDLMIGTTSTTHEILSFQLEIEKVCQELKSKNSQIFKLKENLKEKEKETSQKEQSTKQNVDYNDVSQANEDVAANLKSLQMELEEQKQQGSMAQELQLSLTNSIVELNLELKEAKELAAKEEFCKNELTKRVEELKAELADVSLSGKEKGKDHDDRIQSLTVNVSELESTISGLQYERQSFLDQFESEQKAKNSHIFELENTVKAQTDVIDSLQAELDNWYQDKMNRRKFEIDELEEELKGLKEESKAGKQELAELRETAETRQIEADAKVTQLTEKIQEMESENNKNLADIQSNEVVNSLQKRLKATKTRNDQLVQDNFLFRKKLEQSARKLKGYASQQEEYETMRNESLLLTKQLKELEKTFNKTMEEENSVLKQQIKDLERSLRQARKATLEKQIDQLKSTSTTSGIEKKRTSLKPSKWLPKLKMNGTSTSTTKSIPLDDHLAEESF